MIQSITVSQPSGDSVTLELRSPEKSGFFIKSVDGLTPPRNVINFAESPNIDGALFNSVRANQRNIIFRIGFYNDGSETIEEIRNKVYRYFPSKTQLTIDVVTDIRSATTTGYVETNDIPIFSKEEGAYISVMCEDAYLYGDSITTLFSGTTPSFEFPFSNESLVSSLISFGDISQNTQDTILYEGDQPVGVVVVLDFLGSVTNPSVVNITNSQTVSIDSTKLATLTGSNFVAGDRLIISSKKGRKFVYLIRQGVIINVINALGSYADWFTLEKGDNVFIYVADSGVTNMLMYVVHENLYEGV